MWQVLGFANQKNFFERSIAENNLAHAYLFTGQEMVGKRTFALDLISAILVMYPIPQSCLF